MGRFTTQDDYWNENNRIYGDSPLTVYGHDAEAERDFYRMLAKQLIIEQMASSIFLQTGMNSTDKILEAQRWRMGQLTAQECQYVEDRIRDIKQPSIHAIMQSVNLYGYCANDPIAREDPSGEIWQYIPWKSIQDFYNWALPKIQKWFPKGTLPYLLKELGKMWNGLKKGVVNSVNWFWNTFIRPLCPWWW